MTTLTWRPPRDARVFGIAFLAAMLFEASLILAVGFQGHWLAHPKGTEDDPRFVEAQIFEMPQEAHLVDERPKAPRKAARPELALSKVADKGRQKQPGERPLQEENQTQAGPPLAPTHGPLVIFSPAPTLPSYLRNENIKTSVVIDFFVNAQGIATPRLVNSSGNEELDALALATAKKWQFRPAEQDHRAIDAKVRLRINFEVQ